MGENWTPKKDEGIKRMKMCVFTQFAWDEPKLCFECVLFDVNEAESSFDSSVACACVFAVFI